MYFYLSPILGEISSEQHSLGTSLFFKSYDYFIKDMRSILGYSTLRSGVFVVENVFKDTKVSGTDIYNYLINFGFSDSSSVDVVKLFSTNNRLIDRLVDQGFDIDDILYGMDLKERLNSLGLKSATTTKSYALDDIFIIYQMRQIYIEVTPPHVVEVPSLPEVYRSQSTFTYSTRKQSTKVEIRIWYQSYNKIQENELISKWNEANENAVNLTNEPLIDMLEGVGGDVQPGFELNHEINESESEGSLYTWYGKLIISRAGRNYIYEVL